MLDIKIKGLRKFAKLLDPKKVGRATVNALNQTATEYRKLTVNEAAKIFNISKGRIRKDSSGKETTFIGKARKGREAAFIEYKGKRPGLQHFSSNKAMVNKRKPPKVKIKKGGAAKTIERGFFATAKGSRGLFEREGDKRYPIARRTGPSMKQMYEDDKVKGIFERRIPRLFGNKFDAAFDKLFKS
ncbi:phage tail protein [Candidatus Pacearchaeota archaeon]|nr:phage tail protein [Candidatus Pacearchaeota archaeon]